MSALRAVESGLWALGSGPWARRLGCSALLALLSSGCLITDFGPLEAVPTPVAPLNHAPFVPLGAISPATGVRIELRKDSCSQLLRVLTVYDEDENDQLSARWFLDFDERLRNDNVLLKPTEALLNAGGDSRTQRMGTDYTFHANTSSPGVHVVSVLISDGFSSDAEPAKVKDGKAAWVTTWTIDTTDAIECAGSGS